jgi:hypothetical protein
VENSWGKYWVLDHKIKTLFFRYLFYFIFNRKFFVKLFKYFDNLRNFLKTHNKFNQKIHCVFCMKFKFGFQTFCIKNFCPIILDFLWMVYLNFIFIECYFWWMYRDQFSLFFCDFNGLLIHLLCGDFWKFVIFLMQF